MMNSETKRARQTIKMTIHKTCKRPPTTGAKTEVTDVMNFIQQTMATLQNYNEQLKHHLNKDTTQMGG